MEKIVIVGCSGAGKSTLARELGSRLGLPVVHLDAELWKPGWIMSTDEEERATLDRVLAQRTWIIDGNYGSTMPVRFEAADTIIFLDFPRWLCVSRVLKRWWRYKGNSRPDMGPGCPERLDWDFLRWVWSYNRSSRPKVVQTIERYRGRRTIITLHNRREVRDFQGM